MTCCSEPRALVIGPAPCWADDMARLDRLCPGIAGRAVLVAVNAAGIFWPHRIDWWATLHLEFMPGWHAARTAAGFPPPANVVSATPEWPGVTIMNDEWKGSSGLYGVQLALALDLLPAVLIGIPLNDSGYHGGGQQPHAYSVFHPAWRNAAPWLRGRVFSMSGFPADLLGTFRCEEPTA